MSLGNSVVAILLLLFMVLISLVSVLKLLYFYISTFRSMCAVSIIIIIIIIILWTKQLQATSNDAPEYNVQCNVKMAVHGTHIRNMKEGNLA